MKTPLTAAETLGAAAAALSENAPVTVINDSAGFVVQRLLAMIVNVGTRIAELRIAAPTDIDTAVEEDSGGPLALGDMLDASRGTNPGLLDRMCGGHRPRRNTKKKKKRNPGAGHCVAVGTNRRTGLLATHK